MRKRQPEVKLDCDPHAIAQRVAHALDFYTNAKMHWNPTDPDVVSVIANAIEGCLMDDDEEYLSVFVDGVEVVGPTAAEER